LEKTNFLIQLTHEEKSFFEIFTIPPLVNPLGIKLIPNGFKITLITYQK